MLSQKEISGIKEILGRCSSDVPNCEQCDYWVTPDCEFRLMREALQCIIEPEERLKMEEQT